MSQVPHGDYTQLRVKTRSPSDKEEPSNELVTSGTAYHGRKHVLNVKQNYLPEYDCDGTNDIDYKVLNIDVSEVIRYVIYSGKPLQLCMTISC